MSDTFISDNGQGTYICDGESCGYRGDSYCQNCGSAEGGR